MSVRVEVPAPLRALTAGAETVELEAEDVAGLLAALDVRHPGFRERLLDDKGQFRKFIRLYVNDEDVRVLDEQQTRLRHGDVVMILPAIAGGAHTSAP